MTKILFMLALVISLIVAGCATPSPTASPSTPVPQPGPTEAPSPTTLPGPEAAIEISAAKLYADYEANEVAADQKYKDRLLKVSGVVSDIGISQSLRPGTPVIVLAESLDAPFMEGVTVYLSVDEKAKVATLSKGDMATVVGICEGIGLVRGTEQFGLTGVRLRDSRLLD